MGVVGRETRDSVLVFSRKGCVSSGHTNMHGFIKEQNLKTYIMVVFISK